MSQQPNLTLRRYCAVTDTLVQYTPGGLATLLELAGIHPDLPYQGRDDGDGKHVYWQDSEEAP